MKRSRIDLRVRTDEKEAFEQAAKELGLTISELIRRAVNDYLAEATPPVSGKRRRKKA